MARLKQTIVGVNMSSIDDDNFPKKNVAVCLRYDIGMVSEFVTHKKRQIDRKKALCPVFKNPSA